MDHKALFALLCNAQAAACKSPVWSLSKQGSCPRSCQVASIRKTVLIAFGVMVMFDHESGLCLSSTGKCTLASFDAVLRGHTPTPETHAACVQELLQSDRVKTALTALHQRGLSVSCWPRSGTYVVDATWGLIWLSVQEVTLDQKYQAYMYLGKALDEPIFSLKHGNAACQVVQSMQRS